MRDRVSCTTETREGAEPAGIPAPLRQRFPSVEARCLQCSPSVVFRPHPTRSDSTLATYILVTSPQPCVANALSQRHTHDDAYAKFGRCWSHHRSAKSGPNLTETGPSSVNIAPDLADLGPIWPNKLSRPSLQVGRTEGLPSANAGQIELGLGQCCDFERDSPEIRARNGRIWREANSVLANCGWIVDFFGVGWGR